MPNSLQSGLYGLSGLLNSLYIPPPPPPTQWIAVRPRFEAFQRNLALTSLQQKDAVTKYTGVVECLNRHYYGTPSQPNTHFAIGSWGKDTVIRPPRDVDLYFLLPSAVYTRMQGNIWNRQSTLLQEVKGVLAATYPNTDMSGDGQVVLVRFESYAVEVVPAFLLQGGRYWICDTHNGGSYKETDPAAEVRHVEAIDQGNNRNLRPLIRMMKAWQATCSIPIKSFQLELAIADFLGTSPWRLHDAFWYDWLTRDFFAYLYHRANSFVTVPGTSELVFLGNDWQSRAQTAYDRAVKACNYERVNLIASAGDEWQKIFGQQIPQTV